MLSGPSKAISVGDIYTIGSGDDFSFTPTFWTDGAASQGNYSATFKLIDLGTGNNRTLLGKSGTFSFDFQAKPIPEPTTTIGLGVVGLLAFSLFRHKKRTANRLGSG